MSDGKSGSLSGLLHEVNTPAQPIVKKVAVAPIVSRKLYNKPSIPEHYITIANSFLMTPDMTSPEHPQEVENASSKEMDPDSEQIPETRCICTLTHSSSVMIQCDSCKKWLHEDCVHLKNPKDADPFICIYCQYEIAKAVKSFVRQRLSVLNPMAQRLEIDMQSGRITQLQSVWNELGEIVNDIQDVLKMIPDSLHSEDE